ncbi:MAG: MogA/MoaB family molybdenum cofactor biosynthesis protein [Gemmatimonadota bacterium]
MSASPPRIAVLTISDAGSRGERVDTSGDAIRDWVIAKNYLLTGRDIVPDETSSIVSQLIAWADTDQADVVLTTGGTGPTPRDITPEATSIIIERPMPGIAEALRMSAFPKVPRAILSRGVAGIRGRTLIINLPGSTGGVKDGLQVLEMIIEHAVELLRGKTEH